MRHQMIAMILVGGKGARLKELTKDIAKPAVSFGGKYRLIDFTLSNLTNSQVNIVGLVTQYEPYELMGYIGRGASWDLDSIDGGIFFLTPYAKNGTILWQKGTAHAIGQYFNFIKEHKAKNVLILSGDQIYKMNYQDMLREHILNNRDVTIAGTEVPSCETSRFGIIEHDLHDNIIGFQEKPKNPKSNLASMGLYLFKSETLFKLLNDSSSKEDIDFGSNIIPRCITEGLNVGLYRHDDYWKDVGTVESLYEAHMDMLDNPSFLGLNISKHLPVYSRSMNYPPHIVLEDGEIKGSIVSDGSIIDGKVYHSILGYQCYIHKNALVEDSVLMPNVIINNHVTIKNVIVNRGVEIPENYYLVSEKTQVLDQSNLDKLGEYRE